MTTQAEAQSILDAALQERAGEITALTTSGQWHCERVPLNADFFCDLSVSVGLWTVPPNKRLRFIPTFYVFFNTQNVHLQWSVVNAQGRACKRSFATAQEAVNALIIMAAEYIARKPQVTRDVLLALSHRYDPAQPIDKAMIEEICTVSPFDELAPDIVIRGSLFVLTGEFARGSRAEMTVLIEQLGGKVSQKTVTAQVNYVVVGEKGSAKWAHEGYGSKIERAVELREQGRGIAIIREQEFMAEIDGH